MLIDVHTHLEDPRFDGDRPEVIEKIRSAGVDCVINCGSSADSSESGAQIAGKYDFIFFCAGIHPHEAESAPAGMLERISALLSDPKCVAVGEIGLDYHYDNADRRAQKELFRAQMDIAAQSGKPAVIHSRDAHADTLEILRDYAGKVRGILHCYSGSAETAREHIRLGYSFSFGGVATFKNARSCHDAVRSIPLEYIMLETDAPYLAPHPYRSQRNDSSYIPLILKAVAELKGVSPEEAEKITGENAVRAFGLPYAI